MAPAAALGYVRLRLVLLLDHCDSSFASVASFRSYGDPQFTKAFTRAVR